MVFLKLVHTEYQVNKKKLFWVKVVYLVPDGQTLAGHDVGANLFGTNNYPPIPHITKNQVFIHTSYFLLQLLYVKANTLECTANATVYRKAFISASICFLRHRSQT